MDPIPIISKVAAKIDPINNIIIKGKCFFSTNNLRLLIIILVNIYKDIVVDWLEIVKWPSNSYQNLHLDKASNKTVLTSITYLNENYSGGETYFKDGMIIKPKTGRTLIFDGMHYVHGVKTIKKGTRYTLPVWYKRCEK